MPRNVDMGNPRIITHSPRPDCFVSSFNNFTFMRGDVYACTSDGRRSFRYWMIGHIASVYMKNKKVYKSLCVLNVYMRIYRRSYQVFVVSERTLLRMLVHFTRSCRDENESRYRKRVPPPPPPLTSRDEHELHSCRSVGC